MLGPPSLTAASAIRNLGTRSKERKKERKSVQVDETETEKQFLGFVNGLRNPRNLGMVLLHDLSLYFFARCRSVLTANQIILRRSMVGRRRFDGLAVVGGDGRNRRRRRSLLRIVFEAMPSLV